jgi:tetratricopeptide (TPR) repeat protein
VGTVAAGVGEFETARKLLHESAVVFREIGEDKRLAIVLSNLGHVAGELHDYEAAIEVSKEALALEEHFGRTPNKAITLMNLGTYAQESGDYDAARDWLRRCLGVAIELKYTELMAYAMAVAVRLSVSEEDFERAARLAGVTDGLLEDAGVPLQTSEQAKFEEAKTAARERLGDDAYEAAHASGRAADALNEAALF